MTRNLLSAAKWAVCLVGNATIGLGILAVGGVVIGSVGRGDYCQWCVEQTRYQGSGQSSNGGSPSPFLAFL